jgi:hypothetical protein
LELGVSCLLPLAHNLAGSISKRSKIGYLVPVARLEPYLGTVNELPAIYVVLLRVAW